MAANEVQVNIGQYLSDKKLGITKLVKLNGQAFYSTKEYDRVGQPKVVNVPIAAQAVQDMITNIEKEIAEKQAALASIKQVLADIETAPEILAE